MEQVLTISTRGKGLFAMKSDVKISKGSTCSLRRNPANLSGKRFICDAKSG